MGVSNGAGGTNWLYFSLYLHVCYDRSEKRCSGWSGNAMGKGIGISISISKAWKTFRHHWQQRNHKEMDSIVHEGLTSNLRGLAMHHNSDTKFSCIYHIRQLAHHDVPFHGIVRHLHPSRPFLLIHFDRNLLRSVLT